tara:strand:+ start:153 stop:551 length:399 start_codon:yes stop_codon:yes gene_type:complete
MERRPKGSTFKMKAGKEGPMKKNFPSVFKQTTDPTDVKADVFNPDGSRKNVNEQIENLGKSERRIKEAETPRRKKVAQFEKRHNTKYTLKKDKYGREYYVDAGGRSLADNEAALINVKKSTRKDIIDNREYY